MTGVLRRTGFLALLLAGCSDSTYVIDPFPVSVDLGSGVPALLGCAPELASCEGASLTVVIDTGSAITVVDPGLAADVPVDRRFTSLDLESMGPAGLPVTRARFVGFTAFVRALGAIGIDGGESVQPGVVLGGDQLQGLAMRVDPNLQALFFFPNIAGDSDVLARECSAVLPTPRRGGGTYLFDGAEVSFPATRLVVGTCLNLDANPDPAAPEPRRPLAQGADALLVVSTGLPVTVLSESAFARACAVGVAQGNPDACATSAGTLRLPGTGPEESTAAQLGTIAWLGLAADEVRDKRGPCIEVWASRMMDLGGCTTDEKNAGACRCVQGSDTKPCRAGASAELAGPIAVAVIPDDHPLLQGLRDELRPGVADVDGLLGMNALRSYVTDFDYPGSRLIFRCRDGLAGDCVVRPRLQSFEVRRSLGHCLGQQLFTPTPADQIPR